MLIVGETCIWVRLQASSAAFFARDVAAAGSCQGRLSCRLVLQRLGRGGVVGILKLSGFQLGLKVMKAVPNRASNAPGNL